MWKWPGAEVRVRVSTYWLVAIGVLATAAVLFGDPDRKVADLLKDWQTLLAGLLAIVAAWVSLSGPREQIKQADRLAVESAAREEYAAKAMLPIGLSYISEYADACITLTEHEWKTTRSRSNPVELPQFDRSNLGIIKDCLRYSPTPYRERLVALLSAVQLMEASAVGRIPLFPPHSLMLRCLNVAYLCDVLFDFARGRPDSIDVTSSLEPPTSYIRKSAIFRSHYDDDFWPGLEKQLRQRDENNAAKNLSE